MATIVRATVNRSDGFIGDSVGDAFAVDRVWRARLGRGSGQRDRLTVGPGRSSSFRADARGSKRRLSVVAIRRSPSASDSATIAAPTNPNSRSANWRLGAESRAMLYSGIVEGYYLVADLPRDGLR